MPQQMHDWTLLSVHVNWGRGVVFLEFDTPTGPSSLQADGLHDLHVPRAESWGASVSVLAAYGPSVRDDGLATLSIEMQTGDRIEIVAHSFDLPKGYRVAVM
jgi:hypothetical protein